MKNITEQLELFDEEINIPDVLYMVATSRGLDHAADRMKVELDQLMEMLSVYLIPRNHGGLWNRAVRDFVIECEGNYSKDMSKLLQLSVIEQIKSTERLLDDLNHKLSGLESKENIEDIIESSSTLSPTKYEAT